jgi:hypothetical protein
VIERLAAEVRRELGRFAPIEGDGAAVARVWPRAVGETIARNAWPARLAGDGTLHVATVSATWAFELARLADTILEQLRADLAERTPRALRFAPGPVPDPPAPAAGGAPAPVLETTPEQRAEAAAIAAGIEDEELRELVARAAAASLAKGPPEPRDDRRF